MQENKINNQTSLGNSKNYLEMFLSGKIQLSVPAKTSREQIWNKIYSQVKQQPEQAKYLSLFFNSKYQLSVAATILLLIGAFFMLKLNQTVTYKTRFGETCEYILPDQSKVILNADSKVSYKKNFWNGSREVYLSGEAMFYVTKGNLFTVVTENGSVEVLGTSFNVFTRNADFKVSCFTGKVKVQLPQNTDSVILVPGKETVKTDSNTLSLPSNFNTQEKEAWQNGKFYFDNENINRVFDEIERQFDVKIIYRNIMNRYYTGSFSNHNLNDALEIVCRPMDMEYSFVNKSTIKIHNKK